MNLIFNFGVYVERYSVELSRFSAASDRESERAREHSTVVVRQSCSVNRFGEIF